MDTVIRGQILHKAVHILDTANTFGKHMNLIILHLAMGKI